jgi:predicted DsbA family dithiol-disulfide isomerase
MSSRSDGGRIRVEMFADISCPFAYVGLNRMLRARDERGADTQLRVRAWPLEWINGRQLDPNVVAAEIVALRRAAAPELFSGFDPARLPSSTIRALGLAGAAYRCDTSIGERVSMRLREALFEEGRDVGDPDELVVIGREFGIELPGRAAAEATVLADWEAGRDRGVRGSPHFFVGARSWFCPSLRIRHEGDDFDIAVNTGSLDDFYAAALG